MWQRTRMWFSDFDHNTYHWICSWTDSNHRKLVGVFFVNLHSETIKQHLFECLFFFYTCIRRLSNNTYLSVFFVHLHKKTIEHHLFECPVLTNIRKLLLSHRQIKRTFHISNTTADVDACVLLHSIEPSCRSLGTARLITTKRLCLQTIVFLLQNIIVITVCKHINDLNMNLTYRLRKERTLLWRYMVSCCGESSSTPWLQTIRTLTAWLAIPSVYRYPGNTTLRLWLNGQR